jgi:hypothetical protein
VKESAFRVVRVFLSAFFFVFREKSASSKRAVFSRAAESGPRVLSDPPR